MTADRYLEVCEQLGQEPDLDKMPPEMSDFPDEVQEAILIYNSLGDRIAAELGYLGKDFTNLDLLIKTYEIEDKEFLLELLLWLDRRAIKRSSDELKKAHDKIKRQHNGKK